MIKTTSRRPQLELEKDKQMDAPVVCIASDDNLLQRRYWILEGSGYQTIPAKDLREALGLLGTNKPCCIVADLNMPDQDVLLEACRLTWPDAPLVALSRKPSETLLKIADRTVHPLDGPSALVAAVDIVVSAAIPIPGCPGGHHSETLEHYAIFATNDGRWMWVSNGLCRSLGYTRAELLFKSVVEVAAPEQVPSTHHLWRQFIQEGEQGGEFTLSRKDGTPLHVWYRASVLPDGCCVSVLQPVLQPPSRKGEKEVGIPGDHSPDSDDGIAFLVSVTFK